VLVASALFKASTDSPRRGFVHGTRAEALLATAAERWGAKVVGLVPNSLRPSIARLHRPLVRSVVAQRYRLRYGSSFLADIDDDDELLLYSLDVAADKPALRYYHAVRSYFQGGEWNVAEVDKVLGDHGFALRDTGSLLEFASGWGRVTRHLVHYVDRERITVSDIDPGAVDFVRRGLGVQGFLSTAAAEDLAHDGRYDLIVVVSLFSHLPLERWGPWLRRLGELLADDGMILISTLGMHAYGVNVPDADRPAFTQVTEGFFYGEANETRGRLSADDYGTAYVDETFVKAATAESFPGRFVASCPRALNGFQDVYLLQRTAGSHDDAAIVGQLDV
jgi:2-polyprenyl-3-methyl-5-hydroxy-6-metoxy-1,4-benzoquinol methylase